jgi:hypothetical protein
VKLATDSSLTTEYLRAMPLGRPKELEANAAPVVVGNTAQAPVSEFAGYDMNR